MNRRSFLPALGAAVAIAFGCSAKPRDDPPGQPAGWDDAIRLRAATDLNPDPGIVELNLEAQSPVSLVQGRRSATMWTYNGLVPGPMIRAHLGDQVIVHFTNELPDETTIHWHGLRLPPRWTACRRVPAAVPPGGTSTTIHRARRVLVLVPPARRLGGAGRERPVRPVHRRRPAEPADLGDEVVMVLSDIDVNDDGSLQPADGGGDLGTLFGREGNVLLVNGKVKPTLKARPGLPPALAVHQRREDPLLPDRARRAFVHAHRRRRGLLTAPVDVGQPVMAPGERRSARRPRRAAGIGAGRQMDRLRSRVRQHLLRAPEDLFVVHLEGAHAAPPMPSFSARSRR